MHFHGEISKKHLATIFLDQCKLEYMLRIRSDYRTVRLSFSKLLEKLVVK